MFNGLEWSQWSQELLQFPISPLQVQRRKCEHIKTKHLLSKWLSKASLRFLVQGHSWCKVWRLQHLRPWADLRIISVLRSPTEEGKPAQCIFLWSPVCTDTLGNQVSLIQARGKKRIPSPKHTPPHFPLPPGKGAEEVSDSKNGPRT